MLTRNPNKSRNRIIGIPNSWQEFAIVTSITSCIERSNELHAIKSIKLLPGSLARKWCRGSLKISNRTHQTGSFRPDSDQDLPNSTAMFSLIDSHSAKIMNPPDADDTRRTK